MMATTLNNNTARINQWQSKISLALFLMATVLLLPSCKTKSISSEVYGTWSAQMHKITVRTKPEGKFVFTNDSVTTSITIHKDNTVEGMIGLAEFENGKIKVNKGNPEMTGVAYIIQCGILGKLFINDPANAKEIEIWLSPFDEKGNMEAEIRFTEKLAVFPMAGIYLTKEK